LCCLDYFSGTDDSWIQFVVLGYYFILLDINYNTFPRRRSNYNIWWNYFKYFNSITRIRWSNHNSSSTRRLSYARQYFPSNPVSVCSEQILHIHLSKPFILQWNEP